MSEELTHKEIISSFGEKTARGQVDVRMVSSSERMARGLKSLAIFWGIAVGCVFIPMLHFVLVPLFLILGLAVGFYEWSGKSEISKGEFSCPVCGKSTSLDKRSATFPKDERCGSCFVTVHLEA